MEYTANQVTLKNGKTCVIRRGEEKDAQTLLDYWEATARETRNLAREPEEYGLTPEEVRELIREKNGLDEALNLLAFVDGRCVGSGAFNPADDGSRTRHRCSVGIVLYREFWGLGIGTALLGEVLACARKAGYEQAELNVACTNAAAIGLYEKLGFETVGTIPRAMKYRDGSYTDFLLMVKSLL